MRSVRQAIIVESVKELKRVLERSAHFTLTCNMDVRARSFVCSVLEPWHLLDVQGSEVWQKLRHSFNRPERLKGIYSNGNDVK